MAEEPSDNRDIETKLGELLMQGWTMIAEVCFKETCRTPLMKNRENQQTYCVGCEAWVCYKEKTKNPYRFTQLVSLEGKGHEVSKIPKKIEMNPFGIPKILELKLSVFSKWLNREEDIEKCNQILDAMHKTLTVMKDIKELTRGNN